MAEREGRVGGSALASRRFDPAAGIAPGDRVAGGGSGGRMGSYSGARVYFFVCSYPAPLSFRGAPACTLPGWAPDAFLRDWGEGGGVVTSLVGMRWAPPWAAGRDGRRHGDILLVRRGWDGVGIESVRATRGCGASRERPGPRVSWCQLPWRLAPPWGNPTLLTPGRPPPLAWQRGGSPMGASPPPFPPPTSAGRGRGVLAGAPARPRSTRYLFFFGCTLDFPSPTFTPGVPRC